MALGLGIGLGNFPFQSINNFWRWVELCENSELDSIWQSDRVISSESFMEPMSVMASLAGATTRIKFGMNSVVLGFRHPVMLAKQCATIDQLSGGRLLPSFGIGAKTAPEYNGGGFTGEQRGKRANESLTIMKRLWTEDNVSFEGDFFQLHEVNVNPKPSQDHFPLWVGGSSQAAIERTAKFGTGWIAGLQDPDQVAATVASIKQALKVEARSIAEDHYGATLVYQYPSKNSSDHQLLNNHSVRKIAAIGDSHAIIDRIKHYIESGVSKFVAIPLAASDEDYIEQTQRLIDEVLPEMVKLQ